MHGRSVLRLDDLRRHVVARQRFATRRRRATLDDVEGTIRRLSCVQLDSIATVERSHRLVLASRAGKAPADAASDLLRQGRVFESWAHEACLLPAEDWPLFRFRMDERRDHHWWGPVIDRNPKLAKQVMDAVRERGPLASRDFEGAGGGGLWNLKPAKQMLDCLWTAGDLVVAGRVGFQRLYDLPERVIPQKILEQPVADEATFLRACAVRAVEARGALTERGIREHFRIDGGAARMKPILAALEKEDVLRREPVADGGPDVWLPADAAPESAPTPKGAHLVSPFENMLWDRPFVERLWGFTHLIEVYKKAPQRRYGYYVLPLVAGDSIVGRADLKRDEDKLLVRAFHREKGVKAAAARDALEEALERLAWALGLESG